jgi:hypothetical protein
MGFNEIKDFERCPEVVFANHPFGKRRGEVCEALEFE